MTIAIPEDFPVQPLRPLQRAGDPLTCGTCGLSWDDSIPTQWTPAPSGRCPFEYFHEVPERPPKRSLPALGSLTQSERVMLRMALLYASANYDDVMLAFGVEDDDKTVECVGEQILTPSEDQFFGFLSNLEEQCR